MDPPYFDSGEQNRQFSYAAGSLASPMYRAGPYRPTAPMRNSLVGGWPNHNGRLGGMPSQHRQQNHAWYAGAASPRFAPSASAMMTTLPPATYRPYIPRGPVVPHGNTNYPGTMQGYSIGAATLRHTMPPPNTQHFGSHQQAIYQDPLTALMAPSPAPTAGIHSQGGYPPSTGPTPPISDIANIPIDVDCDRIVSSWVFPPSNVEVAEDSFMGNLDGEQSANDAQPLSLMPVNQGLGAPAAPFEFDLSALTAPSPPALVYEPPSQTCASNSSENATHGVAFNSNHYHNSRGPTRHGAPYPQSQVAVSGTDLSYNNFTSTSAFDPGGAQADNTGRVPSSRRRAVQAKAGPSSSSVNPTKHDIIRSYWLSPEFVAGAHLTTQQYNKLESMLDEPEDKNGPRRCIWVDEHGVPCSQSLHDFKSYIERDRHVHAVHNHFRVGGVIKPYPGVVGGANCRFCRKYFSRDDGHNVQRHAKKCKHNPNKGTV